MRYLEGSVIGANRYLYIIKKAFRILWKKRICQSFFLKWINFCRQRTESRHLHAQRIGSTNLLQKATGMNIPSKLRPCPVGPAAVGITCDIWTQKTTKS